MSEQKPFADAGNFTSFRNVILEEIMPICKPNTWKIVCVTMRKTRGWQKEKDRISISQFMEMSGIVSRSTCLKAINDAVEQGFLIQEELKTDRGKEFAYSLNREYTIYGGTSEEENTGTETVPVPATTGTESVPEPSTETVPTIEIDINIKDDDSEPHFGDVVAAWESLRGSISGFISETLSDYCDEWEAYRAGLPDSHPDKHRNSFAVVKLAIQEMGLLANQPNAKYLKSILDTWRTNGVLSKKPSIKRNGKNLSPNERWAGVEEAAQAKAEKGRQELKELLRKRDQKIKEKVNG